MSGPAEQHGGHEHLSHVPGSAVAGVFAASARLVFDPPADGEQLETAIERFFGRLNASLAEAGCRLVGHIKGRLVADGHGDLTFHATTLGSAPALTGGLAGLVQQAVLTLNVIVFGVDERELPAIVQDAWSGATGAAATWLR